ncbi:MAG: TM2 domain-containing protein [Trueperella sp.]|nr:TM2 domain-containing protein [Trueperella sp.]
MKDETPRLSADEVRFETSPDPLLVASERMGSPNLYAPGPLQRYGGGPFGSRPTGDDLRRAKYARERQASLRAHPSQLGRPTSDLRAIAPELAPMGERSKRTFAIILGLLFGTMGAHNFFLGKPQRAMVNVVVWLIGLAATSATSIIFLMLPIVALVMVECVQIWRGTGDYAEIR